MLKRERNNLTCDGWILEPFHADALNYVFDCGNRDLNDFFANDVLKYENELIAKTYILTPEGASLAKGNPPIAFISFCNDSLIREIFVGKFKGSKSQWNKLLRILPRSKRFNSLPATKIARLGVQKQQANKGVGSHLLNMTKSLFLQENRTGCRFLTVDAYTTPEAIQLYRKNHFQFTTPSEQSKCERLFYNESQQSDTQTVSMYYDLLRSL